MKIFKRYINLNKSLDNKKLLYNYETKKVNQAVKRNINRFPKRFCFQLTEEKLEIM